MPLETFDGGRGLGPRWVTTLMLGLPGCFNPSPSSFEEDTGSDSGSDSNDGGDSDGADSTSGPSGTDDGVEPPQACGGAEGLCLTTPADWAGPVVVASGNIDAAPSCQTYEPAITAYADLEAPAACACECGPAEGATCESALLMGWTDATCNGETAFTQVITADPCNFIPQGTITGEVPLAAQSYWRIETEATGGACAPSDAHDIPAPAYQRVLQACTVPQLATGDAQCDGGATCYEAPTGAFEAALCIWRDGEHECPAGQFSVREVLHKSPPDDQRSCTPCGCGNATGSCPASEAQVYEGYYCNDASIPVGPDCSPVCHGEACSTYAISATLTMGPVVATCEPTGGELEGDVIEVDPVTVCCTT